MKKIIFGITFFTLAIVIVLAFNNVSKRITPEDAIYIRNIIENAGYDWQEKPVETFEEQIQTIRRVQDAILKETPEQKMIPHGKNREPRALYSLGYALCGDRSRFMDKALRKFGMETRYASLYDTSAVPSAFHALLTQDKSKVRSHAMIEVKTNKGWMMVDSVTRWIALDQDNNVYSFDQWKNHPEKDTLKWSTDQDGEMYYLLKDDFAYIYGLYSRHGKLYPPFMPVPDINWRELLQNF